MIELSGVIASLLIIISLLFKTNIYEGALALRVLNTVGSLVFVVYGVYLLAYSTIFLNVVAVVINVYQAVKMKKDYQSTNR